MSIEVKFVGNSLNGGESMYGYHAQWRLDKETRDVREAAQNILNLNGQGGECFVWSQFYSHEETKDTGNQTVDTGNQTVLAGYQGASEKKKVDI